MAKYTIPVTFEMFGEVVVEADSPEEAYAKAMAPETPLPSERDYVDNSFRPSFDLEEYKMMDVMSQMMSYHVEG